MSTNLSKVNNAICGLQAAIDLLQRALGISEASEEE